MRYKNSEIGYIVENASVGFSDGCCIEIVLAGRKFISFPIEEGFEEAVEKWFKDKGQPVNKITRKVSDTEYCCGLFEETV